MTTGASPPSCARSVRLGTLADTAAYAPEITFEQRIELLEAVDVVERLELALRLQRERLAELQIRQRIREDVEEGAQRQQREYILRRQLESIRKELGEDDASVSEDYRSEDRRGRPPRRGSRAGRARGRPAGADGRPERRVLDDPHLPRLAARRAVGEALGGAARPRPRARGPGQRPRRSRGRQGPDRRVPGRAQAAGGARHRRGQALWRDPDPDRAARDRQDLGRRVDRPGAQSRVRTHVARRRARRGRDPRPPPHLHRRAAGPARASAARRQDDEPGDPAGRGRQGRRRLARRSVGRAARGARPGPEPLVPRPLPRRRGRPLRGHLHRHGEHRGDDPRPAARPHGGDPLRRLHGRREGRDRTRLSLAAPARAGRPARGRGVDRRRHDSS